MSYRIRNCPLCGGNNFVALLKARDFHYGNPGEFTLAQCTECSLSFQDPMYDETELSSFYPPNYYSFSDRFSANQFSYMKRVIRRVLGREEHQTKDPKFERPGRLLDVGCGSGWFLSKMRAQGWEVMGVEPSAAAASLGQSQQGLHIFPGSLPDAAFPTGSFDYIRFNHSFEHLSDPNLILNEVHRILAKNGKLMIGVPNRAGLNARVFGQFWYHLALPLHTFSYSTETLTRILAKHSFSIEKVIYNTEASALLGSLQLCLNQKDEPLTSEGRVSKSALARVIGTWAAYLQNVLHLADVIEVTAVKR